MHTIRIKKERKEKKKKQKKTKTKTRTKKILSETPFDLTLFLVTDMISNIFIFTTVTSGNLFLRNFLSVISMEFTEILVLLLLK